MQANLSSETHTLFSQGLTKSLFMLAEAASRSVFSRDGLIYNSNNKLSNEDFVENSYVFKENTDVTSLAPGNIIIQADFPTLGRSQKNFPSSNVSTPVPSREDVCITACPRKNPLSLAAHGPFLPKRASPLSPRSRPVSPYRHPGPSHTPVSDSGYTDSSLRLIKWHWEYRYEHWVNSLNGSDVSFDGKGSDTHEDFNRALFPRAGSLTHPLNHPESRALIDYDWAVRHWSINKVSRTLFLHDLAQRLSAHNSYPKECPSTLSRPWECDWKMKWKIIQDAMLSEHEQLQRYRDNVNDDAFYTFDEDIVMREIFGEDRMDVDECVLRE